MELLYKLYIEREKAKERSREIHRPAVHSDFITIIQNDLSLKSGEIQMAWLTIQICLGEGGGGGIISFAWIWRIYLYLVSGPVFCSKYSNSLRLVLDCNCRSGYPRRYSKSDYDFDMVQNSHYRIDKDFNEKKKKIKMTMTKKKAPTNEM